MAEDVKLEMTGAGAILQSNFLFPGWIKLDNSYTKGQLISECLFDNLKCDKFDKFLP